MYLPLVFWSQHLSHYLEVIILKRLKIFDTHSLYKVCLCCQVNWRKFHENADDQRFSFVTTAKQIDIFFLFIFLLNSSEITLYR